MGDSKYLSGVPIELTSFHTSSSHQFKQNTLTFFLKSSTVTLRHGNVAAGARLARACGLADTTTM
jgi:hypothetical protein